MQGWDTAFKKNRLNDYNVCLTAGSKGSNIYIVDVFRKKMEWPELRRTSVELYAARIPRLVLIEDASAGTRVAHTSRLLRCVR